MNYNTCTGRGCFQQCTEGHCDVCINSLARFIARDYDYKSFWIARISTRQLMRDVDGISERDAALVKQRAVQIAMDVQYCSPAKRSAFLPTIVTILGFIGAYLFVVKVML